MLEGGDMPPVDELAVGSLSLDVDERWLPHASLEFNSLISLCPSAGNGDSVQRLMSWLQQRNWML